MRRCDELAALSVRPAHRRRNALSRKCVYGTSFELKQRTSTTPRSSRFASTKSPFELHSSSGAFPQPHSLPLRASAPLSLLVYFIPLGTFCQFPVHVHSTSDPLPVYFHSIKPLQIYSVSTRRRLRSSSSDSSDFCYDSV